MILCHDFEHFRLLTVCAVHSKSTVSDVVLGARYKPGDVVPKTEYSAVDTILDDVIKAGGILEGRY